MRRYFTCSAAVLSLVAYASACGDDMLVAPEELPVEAALVVAAIDTAAVSEPAADLGTVSDMLEDPFVHLLIGSLNNPAAVHAIRASVTAISSEWTAHKPGSGRLTLTSARLALTSARSEIEVYADDREADADDVVTLAALRLIFDHAAELSMQDTENGETGQAEPEYRSIPEKSQQER